MAGRKTHSAEVVRKLRRADELAAAGSTGEQIAAVAVALRDPATGPGGGVVFHADRGCQYISEQVAMAATELGVLQSVGRTGVCWDDAQQESFWSTLKTEFYDRDVFASRVEAVHAVTGWIETVYNRRPRHSALGYITPVQFERQLIDEAAEAA